MGQDRRNLAIAMLAVAAGLICWQLASIASGVQLVFPTVVATGRALYSLTLNGQLPEALAATVGRLLLGFAAGSICGCTLGLLMGFSPLTRKLLEPYVHFFRFVTPIAWISPAAVWFGAGDRSDIFLVTYATLFIVLVNTMLGVLSVSNAKLRMARTFGASGWQVFRYIVVPSTVRYILAGMRIGAGNSFATVIGAEILTASTGIGYLIYNSRVFFRSDVMFAGIVVVGILGYVFDRVFVGLQRRLLAKYQWT